MRKSRRMLTGGWMGSSLSVFTRGWFEVEINLSTILTVDMTFDLAQPGLSFDVLQPVLTFQPTQPEITFDEV